MITQTNKPASFICKVTGEIKASNKREQREREREGKGQECERLSVAQKGVAASVINSSAVQFLNDLTA